MRGTISAADLDDAAAGLQVLGSGLAEAALADALNHTANQGGQALTQAMTDVFDRPTPWTLKSTRILNATPQRLEAALWVQDQSGGKNPFSAEDYLLPQVDGGDRITRRSERMLREAGILPSDRFVVPGAGARLDAYGNIQRGHLMQILSGLKAVHRSGSDHNATDSARSARKGHARAFFVMKRGSRAIGIAERRGKEVAMVLAFVRQPQYRERYRFHDIARRVAENDGQLEANIDKAIADALSGRLPTNFSRRKRDRAGNIIR
ncbi:MULTISPECIES: hypothetical protein [unclassified Pseudomonas]|uniref:hypothetical protein n=1 Tax=unclassified Pseudomonas TaxID=196821 RepID=UPI0024475CFE|nr:MULTISPECIES: hypothetical protein [unclassified Pseudomonas]MDG9928268.1 hypothetical protein [Pseudomonas sp. GD04042]MDH0481168.1 hypothetical protein [Pseudomonas sp. GD04015]MDH0604504.1 hypothetical protein [Pseudomonas sp. GD03869]